MIDTTPIITEPVRNLLAMNAEVVSAKYIAPVLKMSEAVLVHRVKTGQWDQDTMGRVVISGNRVKFFRLDFLQKGGFISPPSPEKTDSDRLDEIIELIRVQNTMLIEISAYIKMTASGATPADCERSSET